MQKITKEFVTEVCSKLLSTWWGQGGSTLLISCFGLYLTKGNEVITVLAPFSYLVCFLLVGALWVLMLAGIKTLSSLGTKQPTFLVFKYRESTLHTTESENVENCFIESYLADDGYRHICYVTFSKKLDYPSVVMSKESGARMILLESNPKPSAAQFLIGKSPNDQGIDGIFRIDFNLDQTTSSRK